MMYPGSMPRHSDLDVAADLSCRSPYAQVTR